jgi:hypothetical protein
VPDPAFETDTVCEAGTLPPCTSEKLSVVVESWSTGLGGGGTVTVRVTVIVCGDCDAPLAVTVMCPVLDVAVLLARYCELRTRRWLHDGD